MNRDIKFRAWVPSINTMLTHFALYPSGNIGLTPEDFESQLNSAFEYDGELVCTKPSEDGDFEVSLHTLSGDEWLWIEDDNYTLMQYTGLKDKNGVEIYEGDVIKYGQDHKNMVVGWSEQFASFTLNRKGWLYSHYFGEAVKPEECVVIGNIYANPELLTS